jgi:type IV secretion system protein VirB11
MSALPKSSVAVALDRRIQMLRTAMGPVIAAALEDPDVVEIMLNPDRSLWVDRLSSGRAPLGLEPASVLKASCRPPHPARPLRYASAPWA